MRIGRSRERDAAKRRIPNTADMSQSSRYATREGVNRDCKTAAIGCVDCKRLLHENLVARLDPIRARAEALYREPDRVRQILHDGGVRARAEAQRTMAMVRERCGLTRK